MIINLTPHAVVIMKDNGFVVSTIEPSGKVARARQIDAAVGEVEVNGAKIPLIRSYYGETTDLPEVEEGTFYVVSVLTAQAAKAAGRQTSDLLVTADPVRDATGRIIGCRKFSII